VLETALISAAATLVILVSLYHWQHSRRISLLAVGLGSALFAVATLITDGTMAVLAPAEQLIAAKAVRILVLLGLSCHLAFARAFLDLPENAPALARATGLLAAVSGVAAIAQVAMIQARLPIQEVLIGIAALGTLAVGTAARRGIGNARLYLVAWLSLLISIIPAMPDISFVMPMVSGEVMVRLAGFMVASLLLAHMMYGEVRQAHQRPQQHLLELRRTEQERLTRAVEARTRELREAKAQAEEAGKARLAFLSTVSHELRTPLHTILGYAQLLQKRNGRREADAKLATIESSGLQLLRLIDDILEFIRGDSQAVALKPAPLALAELVRQVGDTGQVLALARHNRFRVDLDGGLPATVDVDGRRLLQVLDNLISNGCKYTSNGTVAVRIEPEQAEATEPLPAGMRRLRFTVEDTGVGIPVEQQDRLFQPFSRLVDHEYQPGIGLGLAIARQIVRAMGSDIVVDSAPGRGSRFHFVLMLRTGAGGAVDTAAVLPQIIGYTGPRRTLLVADDIAENRQFLRDLCSDWGFEVLTAGDGAEALAVCRGADKLPDCMLIDQFMPGMDGWAFLREFRALPGASSLPVILVSAACAERPNGFPAGIVFDGVLMKPIRQHELAESLQRLLGLEWTLDQASSVFPTAASSTSLPSANELAALREMLALGRVVAIQRWALNLAETRPDLADFAREAALLAEAVNLPGLELLLQRAEQAVNASAYQRPSGGAEFQPELEGE